MKRSTIRAAIFAGTVAFVGADGAWAADPVVQAEALSPWMVRLRGVYVVPRSHSKVRLYSGRGHTTLPGHKNLHVSKQVIPELDISYFFTDNIAAELILGVTKHHINGRHALDGVGRVGSTWILPPTLTLQYHFDLNDTIKPYIGAGVNWTLYFNRNAGKNFSHFRLRNTWGVALQAGVDFKINDHWGVNLDVKKIMMRPHAKLDHGAVKSHVRLDPWMFGAGVSYRF